METEYHETEVDEMTEGHGMYTEMAAKGARIAALEATIERHWWWRTPATGTLCVWCGASCHFDLGIDDIQHKPDCEYVQLAEGGTT